MSTDEIPAEYGVRYLEFNEGERVVANGYEVPNLTAFRSPGKVTLVLDRRIGADFPPGVADQVVLFVADALAIGAGYSCFGVNSQRSNPFKVRCIGVTPNGNES